MSKHKFVAELSKLLGFMSSWDRQAVIDKYNAMFDEAEDPDILIAKLGTPTKLAIALARDYVPTDAPAARPAAAAAPAPEEAPSPADAQQEETGIPEQQEAADAPADEPAAEPSAPAEAESEAEAPEPAAEVPVVWDTAEEPAPPQKSRRLRPVVLAFYIPPAVIIGLPVAIVLIVLGLPFILLGAAAVGAVIYAAVQVIALLTMVSDILLVLGAALIVGAVGLFITWLGLWISLELGYLWIGKVIFGLGAKICYKKEGTAA